MSEYQYYEFQAVDRPLTQEQVSELRSYSTRAQITLTSFINVYNWGDFKGNPNKWMEKYFDAFLYLANWGTRRLMLRIPKRLLEHDATMAYCTEESMSFRSTSEHHILSFYSEQEDYEWADGEGWLASLVPLRADLMQGDHRCLYLAWLLGVQRGELDYETFEPPIPTGLGELSATLQSFIDFFGIDPDLVTAAAEKSAAKNNYELPKEAIARWVDSLSDNDKDSIIKRLLESDKPYIGIELRQQALRETRGVNRVDKAPVQNGGLRSVGQIVARAEEIAEERREKEAIR